MKIRQLIIMGATLFGLTTIANAHGGIDEMELGQPSHAGSGCPSGTVAANLSPDKTALSILFDDYVVEAGGISGKRLDRKNCSVSIPVQVPQGYSITLIGVDYRGYTYVPRGARARFSTEYFFAGQRGPRFSKTFRNTDDDYILSNDLIATSLVWSACGKSVNLRMNSSMLAVTNRQFDDVLATVDSVDVDSGVIYQIQWKKCGRH